jgi:hypothetical protein
VDKRRIEEIRVCAKEHRGFKKRAAKALGSGGSM